MINVTFENLPQLASEILENQKKLIDLLLKKDKEQTTEPADQILTIEEAAEFLHIKKPTLYSKVSKGTISVMKQGKRLYFSRKELIEYLKQGRIKTNAEIENEAQTYLKNNIKVGK